MTEDQKQRLRKFIVNLVNQLHKYGTPEASARLIVPIATGALLAAWLDIEPDELIADRVGDLCIEAIKFIYHPKPSRHKAMQA